MLIEIPERTIITETYDASNPNFDHAALEKLSLKYNTAKEMILRLSNVGEKDDHVLIVIEKPMDHPMCDYAYLFQFYYKPLLNQPRPSKSGTIVVAIDDSVIKFEQSGYEDQNLIGNDPKLIPTSIFNEDFDDTRANPNSTGDHNDYWRYSSITAPKDDPLHRTMIYNGPAPEVTYAQSSASDKNSRYNE